MFGATLPSAAAGFRPICVQVCASVCTSAHAFMERTIATLFKRVASFGIRPVGQLILPIIDGAKLAGVTPFTTLRSNMSVWLGAPAIMTKMQYLALFSVVTGCEVITVPAAMGCDRQAIVTPAPANWKKLRRERCGRSSHSL